MWARISAEYDWLSSLSMGRKLRQTAVAAVASVGAVILTSCVSNIDVPDTVAATVTVTGEADRASADSGECTIGGAHVAPNDVISISAGSAVTTVGSTLEVASIELNPDGTAVCTYTARFDAVPGNQRSYEIRIGNYLAPQSFTSDDLKNGATYRLHSSTPADSDTGTDREGG